MELLVEQTNNIIKENSLNAEVIKHPDHPITSLQSHLEFYGGSAENVLKCLCMVSKGKPLVVMASGEIKVDTKKLSKASGLKDIRMARFEELDSLFHRKPGTTGPFTIPEDIPIFADEKLFEKGWVVGSAGSSTAGLKIEPKDILKVVQPIVADLAKE